MDQENSARFASELREQSVALIESLQFEDYTRASEIIHSLSENRNDDVFQSVGKLTRALHEAIVNFNVDSNLTSDTDHISGSEMSNASDRLQGVIDMTQDAANRTMDRIEIAAPIAKQLGDEAAEIKLDWEKLRRRELDKEGFNNLCDRTEHFLVLMAEGTEHLNDNLHAIILDQGYQDLTGQVLKKVIGLITDVEKELVTLVSIAGQVDEATGIKHSVKKVSKGDPALILDGPQLNTGDRPGIAQNQGDVDDLLSSLGF